MFRIPLERLPPGFGDQLLEPQGAPAEPAPASTVVLLRDAPAGMQALLMKRHRASGFVPGAYVFPGGRVDRGDADPALDACMHVPAAEPPRSYWAAAAREVLEETGVLLGATEPPSHDVLLSLRGALMDDRADLHGVLRQLRLSLDLRELVYAAHWITPVVEPRRFDTRFFLAPLPEGARVEPDPREMDDAVWLAPREALDRFGAGTLPMVFPTVATLESLVGFECVRDALDAFRHRTVEPVLPRLVRTPDGYGILIDPESET